MLYLKGKELRRDNVVVETVSSDLFRPSEAGDGSFDKVDGILTVRLTNGQRLSVPKSNCDPFLREGMPAKAFLIEHRGSRVWYIRQADDLVFAQDSIDQSTLYG